MWIPLKKLHLVSPVFDNVGYPENIIKRLELSNFTMYVYKMRLALLNMTHWSLEGIKHHLIMKVLTISPPMLISNWRSIHVKCTMFIVVFTQITNSPLILKFPSFYFLLWICHSLLHYQRHMNCKPIQNTGANRWLHFSSWKASFSDKIHPDTFQCTFQQWQWMGQYWCLWRGL